MDYVTLSGVEIVTVGMKWPAVSGPVTLTLEHLADMVAASDDPLIRPPRVKIGHSDPRFDDGIAGHDPFYDGDPVFGTITNMRLANDGAVLIGDLVEVPAWLAAAAPSAFPSRSAEWVWDVETEASKNYTAVLTAVAFLGDSPPAIKDLEDLQRVLSGEWAEAEGLVTATEGDPPVGAVTARADIDKVIDTFYADFAIDDRYWWWVRSVWTDPNELIVDDDEGNLLRVPFTSDDNQEITFDTEVPVKQVFVDAASGEERPAVEHDGKPALVFASTEKSRPPEREKKAQEGGSEPSSTVDPTATPASTQETDSMDPKLLRKALGLSPEASDDEVNAKIAAQAEAQPDPATPPEPAPEGEPAAPPEGEPAPAEGEPEGEPEPKPGEEPAAPAEGEAATVSVSKEVWEETQRQAREGAAARSEQVTERREGILEDACKAGKITAAAKDAWRTKLVATPEATEKELEDLQAGLVPVDPKGTSAPLASGAQIEQVMAGAFGVTPKKNGA